MSASTAEAEEELVCDIGGCMAAWSPDSRRLPKLGVYTTDELFGDAAIEIEELFGACNTNRVVF